MIEFHTVHVGLLGEKPGEVFSLRLGTGLNFLVFLHAGGNLRVSRRSSCCFAPIIQSMSFDFICLTCAETLDLDDPIAWEFSFSDDSREASSPLDFFRLVLDSHTHPLTSSLFASEVTDALMGLAGKTSWRLDAREAPRLFDTHEEAEGWATRWSV